MAGRIIPPSLREILALVGPDKQTIIWPALEGELLTTDGLTTGRAQDITRPPFDEIAPFIQSVTACTAMENKTANFKYKGQAQGSTTGRTYNTAVDICGYITANGETTENAYTSVTNLGLKTRWAVMTANGTGAAIESAVVWLYLVFRLRT